MSGRRLKVAIPMTGLALLLLASAVGSWAEVTTAATGVPTERGRAFMSPTAISNHRVTYAGSTHNLALGAHGLEVLSLTRDAGERRLIEEIKLTLNPSAAWYKTKLNWLRNPVGLEPDFSRPSKFLLEFVELKEGTRTLAVLRVDRVLDRGIHRLSLADPAFPVGARFEQASWATTEILFHARFIPPESPAFALPVLADSGRITWTYRPQAGSIRLGRPQAVGRPLAPGLLAPIGSGLSLYPDNPYAGETFTASIIFQNRGERPTPRTPVRWQYDERLLEAVVPALEAGRDATLEFQAVAGRIRQPVTLRWNDQILSAPLDPLLKPILALGRLAVDAGYRDEPLVVRLAVGNSGTGDAQEPRLFLSAGVMDTTLMLPAIASGETRLVAVALTDTLWPETLAVVAGVATALDLVDTARVVAVRPSRPAPDLRLAGLSFLGEPIPGGAGRAVAVFENVGSLEGFVRAVIAVSAVPSGAAILRVEREERVPAGGRVSLVTPIYAWANGITRADLEWQGGQECLQAYSSPAPFMPPDGETVLVLASSTTGVASSTPATEVIDEVSDYVLPRRIEDGWKFTLPPIENLDELAPNGRLVISSACWLTNPSGTEFLPEQAAARREVRPSLKATIRGAGFSDAFTVTAAETQFIFALPRSALDDTLTVTLSAAGRSPVYLTAPPHLRMAFGTPERGTFTNVHVTETGLYLTVANTARWIPAREVTIAASYAEPLPNPDGANRIESAVVLPRGATRDIFLRLPTTRPGRMQLEVSLPLSSTPAAQRLEQLVLPYPRPVLDPFRAIPGRSSSGETGILVLLGVSRSPVNDLILAAQEANAAVRLTVPADETAVAWFPGARTASVDYGALSARRTSVGEAPATSSSLRIIDCGGDTPAHGQFFQVRFARGGANARPAGRVFLAINGLLRAVRNVPATLAGDRWVDGFSIVSGPGASLEVVLFEEDAGGVRLARAVFDVADEPSGTTRVERDWIRANLLPAATLAATAHSASSMDSGIPPTERAAQAAWAVASFLAQVDPNSLGELSPEPARSLARLGADTSAIGRMLYRQQLWTLVEQWQKSADRLALGQLPITLSITRFSAFRATIQRLQKLSEEVGVINRRAVFEELGMLATHVDHVLGKRIDPELIQALK